MPKRSRTKKLAKHERTKKKSTSSQRSLKKELDQVLRTERAILAEERRVEAKEQEIENKELEIEKEEVSDLEKIKQIQQEIKTDVEGHPLARVTSKDVVKGLVGAFVGLAIHYTFVYGVKIAEHLTIARATFLMIFTFVIGLLFVYATGFRKIDDKALLIFMPLRLGVLYLCALVMSILVLFLFYPEFGHSFADSYKMIAGVMLAAVIGACTADLLGKE